MKPNIIAVDFDGTLCENKWQEIGMPNEELIEYLKKRQAAGEKLILWTNRVDERLDEVIKWYEEHGLVFDTVNDNLWDYGRACYESALKAFNSLCEDGHSGFSIGSTKAILNRLINNKPLLPIEDTDDVWNDISDISGLKGEEVNYQCKRMPSLFKYVYADGTVEYIDVDRYHGANINCLDATYRSGLIDTVMDELYPITMPYMPADRAFKIYTEDFLVDPSKGDYDTVGILYAITPSLERVEINRYFKETEEGFDEIDKAEYDQRKEMAKKRQEDMKNGSK